MSIRWHSIIFISTPLIFCSCTKEKSSIDISRQHEILEKWIQTEMLHQKFTAERKYIDSIQCIESSDSLTHTQRDSILRYWSEHPHILREITNNLMEAK